MDKVVEFQHQLLARGYRFIYLCDEIDSLEYGLKRYYQVVGSCDQPLSPCYNGCPIRIDSDEGLQILSDHIHTTDVNLSLV